MKIQFLACFLLALVSFPHLQAQTIDKKDLEGHWRFKSNDDQRHNFTRFYHFYDDNTYKIYIDSLSNFFMQGTFTIKKIQGESVLIIYTSFLTKTDSSGWLIRRSSPNSFILKDAMFTKSGGLKWKWNEIVKSLTYILDRINIKTLNTKAI